MSSWSTSNKIIIIYFLKPCTQPRRHCRIMYFSLLYVHYMPLYPKAATLQLHQPLFSSSNITNSFFSLNIWFFSWNMFLLVVSVLAPFHHSGHSLKVTSSEKPSQTPKPQSSQQPLSPDILFYYFITLIFFTIFITILTHIPIE